MTHKGTSSGAALKTAGIHQADGLKVRTASNESRKRGTARIRNGNKKFGLYNKKTAGILMSTIGKACGISGNLKMNMRSGTLFFYSGDQRVAYIDDSTLHIRANGISRDINIYGLLRSKRKASAPKPKGIRETLLDCGLDEKAADGWIAEGKELDELYKGEIPADYERFTEMVDDLNLPLGKQISIIENLSAEDADRLHELISEMSSNIKPGSYGEIIMEELSNRLLTA